jgi:hypothetical protein
MTESIRFEPVPLPSLLPGGLTSARLDPVLREWVGSAPIRALAEASGWEWPDCRTTDELLDRLATLSTDWDFRSQHGGVERDLVSGDAAQVNGRLIPEELIVAAAEALGLVSATPVPDERFSALVVLSGLVRACVNRTKHAADLLSNGVGVDSVTVLGGHRKLSDGERAQAAQLGFGEQFDEADVVVAATREAFGLGEPQQAKESGPPRDDWDDELWSAWSQHVWPDIQVLIAPSGDPGRRVNTVDQLRYWASENGIGRDDRILLLTTQIYVPYQQLGALQVLGVERGCSVYCCGVDATSSYLPPASFTGRSYLQEIRSALRAAAQLLAAARRENG